MVKLVEYPESSDDEQDARSDFSQWSSFSDVPSSPSDSFSCPMRTPESDQEDATSSVATDDLDPDNAMDTQEQRGVFYAWKDLQAAFEDNPFKRRSVEEDNSQDESLVTDEVPIERPASEPFGPVDGGFTIGRSDKTPKPYKFAASHVKRVVKVPPPVQIEEDTPMSSPSSKAKAASRTTTNGEFLFGQAYKNRKPFGFARQNSAELFQSSGSGSTPCSWGSKVPIDATAADKMDVNKEPTAASAFFTTGVPELNTQRRHTDRRKKTNMASASVPPQKHKASVSSFDATPSGPTFGSTLFGTASATQQQTNASFASPTAPFGLFAEKVYKNDARVNEAASPMPSTKSSAGCTGGTFVFGTSKSNLFHESGAPTFQSRVFGPSAAPAKPNTGTSDQFVFGNGTSRHPFEFGEPQSTTQTEAANSHFSGLRTDNAAPSSASTTDSFQIGSTNVKKNSRVRPRKSGMFTNKNTPRKDTKFGVSEPEPSPGFSSTTPSPFGIHDVRRRKNARLRQYGRSPPADPFVTPTFQTHPTSSPFVPSGEVHPNAVRPTAKKGVYSGFKAPATGVGQFDSGITQQQDKTSASRVFSFQSKQSRSSVSDFQNSSRSSVLESNGSDQTAKSQQTNEDAPRPAFAGSRRILRAALRNVGARGDRAKSAPPTSTGYHHTEGDADMDSEDERDWEELKRLGGVAHCSRRYEESAEYYRQSIEVLETLLYHGTIPDSSETRTDKAKLHANRAASLMMLMRITEAQHECRRSIEVDATYARAYLRLGRIQVQLGDTAHAQANLDTARHLMEGQDGEVWSGDQADQDSLIKMEATIKKLIMLQGEIEWYVDSGDFKQALVHTESALALASSSRKLQVQKGRILLHQREFDKLVSFCTSIIEKQQTTKRKLSSPSSKDGMKTKSRKNEAVEKIALIGIDLGLLWATTLHYQNKVEDAVRILNALEVVAPCSSHVIQLKQQWHEMKQLKHDGNERFKQGEYQAAVRSYSEAVQIDPHHQEFCAIIFCNRAAAQMGLERYHTAILDCNEALQRKPNYPRALLRRGRCHVALKMYHEAVKDFDRYLREQAGDVHIDAVADVRRERNEAKAAIAKAREEARQREAAKKRAEREQRQRRQHHWEDTSRNDSKFYENFRRNSSSSNRSSYGSNRHQSSGTGGRASFMAPKTQRRTHYDVLGIEKTSTIDHIKKAYRKLALVYHPDKAKTSTHAELFKEMTAAYNVLSDEGARAKYDRELIYNRFGNFYEN